MAGGLNSYQYVPNPTGWVDPLGLSSCPGDLGREITEQNGETPEQKLNYIGEDPEAPAHNVIHWTAHGYNHSPSKNMSWKAIIESTKTGPAKYKPGTDIESLERGVFKDGKSSTNGKPWKVKDFESDIGASGGKTSRWIRIELSAKTIHGHPITEQEFRKLTK